MAKLNIELDLDYLEEGRQSIEDLVRDEIINNATNRIESVIKELANKKLQSKVEEIIDEKAEKITNDIIDNFIATQKFPIVKGSWGTDLEYNSITEILTGKLKESLNRYVDKDGKYCDSSYNKVGTRLDWLTGKLAEKYANEKVQEATKDIKTHIEKFILEKVKGEIMGQLSSGILKNIDFTKIG